MLIILLNLSKFFTKSLISFDSNNSPLKLSFIISFGPSGQLLEKTGTLHDAASIKTKPGSSHNEDKINPCEELIYGKMFFT